LIALLGDSHTRSYVSKKYIAVRIFLAQGRKNNFHSIFSLFKTFFRYVLAASKLRKSGLDIGFIIGEPDVRILVYGRWIIDLPDDRVFRSTRSLSIEKSKLDSYCTKVRFFLFLSKIFSCKPSLMIGAGTPNPEMSEAVLALNSKLKRICADESCLFFSPQDFIVDDGGCIRNEYIGYSIFNKDQKDFTHLSHNISSDFEVFMDKVYEPNSLVLDEWKNEIKFHKKFIEVNDFDTFTVKPSFISGFYSMVKKIIFRLKFKIRSNLR
jgi:hypothetical protein